MSSTNHSIHGQPQAPTHATLDVDWKLGAPILPMEYHCHELIWIIMSDEILDNSAMFIFRVYPLFWINHIILFFKPCKIVDFGRGPSFFRGPMRCEDREMSEMGVSSFTQGGSPIHLSILGWDFSQAKLDLLQGGVLRLHPWCFAAKPCIEIRDDSKMPIYWKAKAIGKTCSTRIFLILGAGFLWVRGKFSRRWPSKVRCWELCFACFTSEEAMSWVSYGCPYLSIIFHNIPQKKMGSRQRSYNLSFPSMTTELQLPLFVYFFGI